MAGKQMFGRFLLGLALAMVLIPTTGAAQPISTALPLALSNTTAHYYLSQALTLQGVGALSVAERQVLFRWAGAIGTRFAGRIGGFWFTPRSVGEEQASFDTTRRIAAELHAQQPAMIVQGTVFEIVYAHVDSLPVPNRIRATFGEDTIRVPFRRFRFADMMYPGYFSATDSAHYRWDARPAGQAPGVPDMSRPETQRWFYYVATRQIDAGCEALHFGQVMLMDNRDAGHHAWWGLLQRIRAYARTRNRGWILCDAHTHGEYYDPDPAHPLPTAQRQLLFDFHSFPLRPIEEDTLRHGLHGARLGYANWPEATAAIYGQSGGGLAPDGQLCTHLLALVEFDNGPVGIPGKPGQWPLVWGLDEMSWFATQPPAYRDQWLVYAYAQIKRLDPNAYIQFPGLRGVTSPPHADYLYRADQTSQGDVIRACWAGETTAWANRLLFIGPVQP